MFPVGVAVRPGSGAGAALTRGAQRHRRWFRAPARCRSETGAPAVARREDDWGSRRPRAFGPLCRAPTGRTGGGRRSKPSPRFFAGDSTRGSRPSWERAAYCRARKKQMAANRRFAAGDFGGKCERGLPPFTINNNRIGTRRRAPKVHKGVSIPEPGAAGSRVPRPQPLLLRGLRAALAALRKPGAKRRAISGRGPNEIKTHGSDQHSTMAPPGDRSTYAMESVKGGYPLSQSVTTESELAEARVSARESFDCRRVSVRLRRLLRSPG